LGGGGYNGNRKVPRIRGEGGGVQLQERGVNLHRITMDWKSLKLAKGLSRAKLLGRGKGK